MTRAEAIRWVVRGHAVIVSEYPDRLVIGTRVVVDPETGEVYGGATITVWSTP